MKNKKRVLAISLIVALIAIISLGSLAWFTDTAEEINIFTIGEVSIGLHDEDGEGNDFNDNPHPILPGVPVDKVVYVTNDANTGLTGNDAYVRTFIGIPEKLDSVLEKTWDTTSDWTLNNDDYIAEIDGVRYKVYQFTYTGDVKGKLAAGDKTANVLSSVMLKEEVDCKGGKLCVPDPEAEGGYKIFDFDINALRELKVPVAMQAVQTAGFDSADEAFDAAFNGCPWDQAAPEQNQEENPADINYKIPAQDLNKDVAITWDAPDGTGYNKIDFVFPAGTFSDPVEIYVDAGKSEEGPAKMWICFYKLDENGNRIDDGDGGYECTDPDLSKDFKIVIDSPYEFCGSDKIKNLVGFELDNPMLAFMGLYNHLDWNPLAD